MTVQSIVLSDCSNSPCSHNVQAYLTRRSSYVCAVAHVRYALRRVPAGAVAAWAIHLGDLRPFRPFLGGPDCDGSSAAVAIARRAGRIPSSSANDDWTYRLDHASWTIQISIAQESSDSPAITRIEVPSVGLASLAGATPKPLRMASPPAHALFCPVAGQLSRQQSFTSTYGLPEGAPVRFSDVLRRKAGPSRGPFVAEADFHQLCRREAARLRSLERYGHRDEKSRQA